MAGAYVMREIPDVIPLCESMTLPQSHDPVWRAQLLTILGQSVGRLHDQKFIHRDLYWRNILISLRGDFTLHFIDCPGGSYQWGPFFQYGRIRDLACLYKDLHRHFSKTELLRCFLAYVGRPHLNASDKKLLRGLMMRLQKIQYQP